MRSYKSSAVIDPARAVTGEVSAERQEVVALMVDKTNAANVNVRSAQCKRYMSMPCHERTSYSSRPA